MQEIWLREAEVFFDRLEHESKRRDDNATHFVPLSFGGSGLGIASRFPILAHAQRKFVPSSASTERFARKGMLHVRVRAGDTDVDVITTHLHAGLGRIARRVRARQLRELRSFADEKSERDVPTIVCGDLNVDGLASGGRREYGDVLQALSGFIDLGADTDAVTYDPRHNDLARRHAGGEPHQRLDYIFVRDPAHRLVVKNVSRMLDEPEGSTWPSDHFALAARFQVR